MAVTLDMLSNGQVRHKSCYCTMQEADNICQQVNLEMENEEQYFQKHYNSTLAEVVDGKHIQRSLNEVNDG